VTLQAEICLAIACVCGKQHKDDDQSFYKELFLRMTRGNRSCSINSTLAVDRLVEAFSLCPVPYAGAGGSFTCTIRCSFSKPYPFHNTLPKYNSLVDALQLIII